MQMKTLLLCIIVYYFKGMYWCVYIFVSCCIIVLFYCYVTVGLLHCMRRLERIIMDLRHTNTILTN